MDEFDVCIVGAGPAGLAVLSALRTPEAVLSDRQLSILQNEQLRVSPMSVCVVSPSDGWLDTWRTRFAALGIPYLRSPLFAHPDAFSPSALREYAFRNGRENEIREVDLTHSSLKGSVDYASGLYNIAGSELFEDFCADLSATKPHDFIVGTVESIEQASKDRRYSLSISCKSETVGIRAKRVVLALGMGSPRIPPYISAASTRLSEWLKPRIFHTSSERMLNEGNFVRKRVLVIGGGLSAVQATLLAIKRGASRITLCSRSPLVPDHYDVPLAYMNRNAVQRGSYHEYRFKLLEVPVEERARYIESSRAQSSVPLEYVNEIKSYAKTGKLKLCVDQVVNISPSDDNRMLLEFEKQSEDMLVDTVILGTGYELDCNRIPLMKNVRESFRLPVENGIPVLDEDLCWGNEDILVVGAFARAQIGPDAGNLGGAARAAQICASYLGVFDRLREDDNIFGNRYNVFIDETDDEEEESSSDEDS